MTRPGGAVDHMDEGQLKDDTGDVISESVKEDEGAVDHKDESQLKEGHLVNESVITKDEAAKDVGGSAKLDSEGYHEVICRDIVPYVDFIFKDLISLLRRD